MGKRVKIWSRVERVVALCVGLGIVLAGCAVQKPETGSLKSEVNKVEIPSPENFATIGKPTKTIQTPNGPVEIYDPTRDPEVRAAFRVIYDKNNLIVSTYGGPWDKNGEPIYGNEGKLLKKAREAMAYSLLQGRVCKAVIDASCKTKYYSYCKQNPASNDWPNCETKENSYSHGLPRRVDPMFRFDPVFPAVPKAVKGEGMVICTFDKTEIISTDDKIIGPISPEPFEKQLQWFFSYDCQI